MDDLPRSGRVSWRKVAPPLTADMLRPLEPECSTVEFSRQLSEPDVRRLAEVMRPRLDVNGWADDGPRDLGFLVHFPWLRAVTVAARSVRSFAGLESLTSARSVHLGQTLRRPSLSPLAGLRSLRHLSLDSQDMDLSALSGQLGGTRDLSLLPAFTEMQYLQIWMVRGLSDLSPVADLRSLDELFLQALKHVTELPPLGRLTRLRRVHLQTMKGLQDLAPLLTAPALEEIVLLDMGHLELQNVALIARHPALQRDLDQSSDGRRLARSAVSCSSAAVATSGPRVGVVRCTGRRGRPSSRCGCRTGWTAWPRPGRW